jgi:hypothetical protein
MPGQDGLAGCHVPLYAEGKAVGVARTPFDLNVGPHSYAEGLYTKDRWRPSALVSYADGRRSRYADGQRVSAEVHLRRRLRRGLSSAYSYRGHTAVRRGL